MKLREALNARGILSAPGHAPAILSALRPAGPTGSVRQLAVELLAFLQGLLEDAEGALERGVPQLHAAGHNLCAGLADDVLQLELRAQPRLVHADRHAVAGRELLRGVREAPEVPRHRDEAVAHEHRGDQEAPGVRGRDAPRGKAPARAATEGEPDQHQQAHDEVGCTPGGVPPQRRPQAPYHGEVAGGLVFDQNRAEDPTQEEGCPVDKLPAGPHQDLRRQLLVPLPCLLQGQGLPDVIRHEGDDAEGEHEAEERGREGEPPDLPLRNVEERQRAQQPHDNGAAEEERRAA
mmetsp:Transcript_79232/g.246728  ORF Transcript_79232/g.246728 Transcript_79232/m.246728 type:complete len:292 (-) Transcript_79232:42-917(-)